MISFFKLRLQALRNHIPPTAAAFFCSELSPGRWVRLVLFSFAGFLILSALVTIAVDPCMRYSVRLGPSLYIMDYETIPGVLRQKQYDSVVIGSSTSQNFNLKEFRTHLKLSPVKATASGCYWATGKLFFDLAREARGTELKTVVQSLEIPAFFRLPDEHKTELPDFLYKKPGILDCCYWWNYDLWNEYLKNIRRILFKTTSTWADYRNPDLMFAGDYRADQRKFGVERLRKEFRNNRFRPQDSVVREENFPISFRKNILDSVRGNPGIRFIFYFPPYSIFYLATAADTGLLRPALNARKAIAEQLLAYGNVELFDFQTDFDVITNPDCYKDLIHFIPAINDRMVRKMGNGENRIHSVAEMEKNNSAILDHLKTSPPEI